MDNELVEFVEISVINNLDEFSDELFLVLTHKADVPEELRVLSQT